MKHINGPYSRSSLTNVQEGDKQPNATDLRVKEIFQILPQTFTITEDEKHHRGSVPVRPDNLGFYTLMAGTSYEVIMENIITVGPGEAGWVVTRSTLNRNGVYLTSGLYDSGYNGVMAAVMHVTSGPMRIKAGTRVGQYLSFDAEALHSYEGSYGIGTEDDVKYTAPPVTAATIDVNTLTEGPKHESVDTGAYGQKIEKGSY